MTHRSENAHRLDIQRVSIAEPDFDAAAFPSLEDAVMVLLPLPVERRRGTPLDLLHHILDAVVEKIGPRATLVTVGETPDLVHAHSHLRGMRYQLWIAIKRSTPRAFADKTALPEYHFGALVHTRYVGSLKHTRTRLKYTYCPACDKTTKDYGGKKHTYNSYGTLISDVWRDIAVDPAGSLEVVTERFADLFGIPDYRNLVVLDFRRLACLSRETATETSLSLAEPSVAYAGAPLFDGGPSADPSQGRLILNDALDALRDIPDNSVDFAFADPPYNLNKKYNDYSDDLSIAEYFAWCDAWLTELGRVVKPGRTCAILNIPLWDIRHFLHLEKTLRFQNWIVWDALSFPVRQIMPAHYGILCFSKGRPRPLPGLVDDEKFPLTTAPKTFLPLQPLGEGYCRRASCVKARRARGIDDRGPLTDLWWDIHRLKHNSRRVDHPCQLPPQLMYRLITIFTRPGEIVLDPFDGAGTTSLTAHQLNRRYIGIELSEKYHNIALSRHREIRNGLDPFRKARRKLTEKNSPVERMPARKYEVPKKTLQLEVRRVAQMLGRLPSREDMIAFGKYPIRYYDEYFISWGEVCAAARNDGMSEEKHRGDTNSAKSKQLRLF